MKCCMRLALQLDVRNLRVLTHGNFGYRVGKVTAVSQADEILDQRALRTRFRHYKDPRIGSAVLAVSDEQQVNWCDAGAVTPDVDQRAVVKKCSIYRGERVLPGLSKRSESGLDQPVMRHKRIRQIGHE